MPDFVNIDDVLNVQLIKASNPMPEEEAAPVCEKCKGHEYIYVQREDGSTDFSRIRPCNCVNNLEQIGQRLLRVSGIPEARYSDTFDKLKPLPKFKPALDATRALAEGEASFSMLVLEGAGGVGKTHLLYAACILRCTELLEVARYTTVRALLSSMQMAMNEENTSAEHVLNRYIATPFLAIDEIGKQYEGSSGWAGSAFEILMDSRYASKKPTICATNYEVSNFPESIRSRLQDIVECRVIRIMSEDYRLKER